MVKRPTKTDSLWDLQRLARGEGIRLAQAINLCDDQRIDVSEGASYLIDIVAGQDCVGGRMRTKGAFPREGARILRYSQRISREHA